MQDSEIQELRSQIAALLEWQAGARENASAIAVRLGIDCDSFGDDYDGDAATWHASVKAINILQERNAELETRRKFIGREFETALSELAACRKALERLANALRAEVDAHGYPRSMCHCEGCKGMREYDAARAAILEPEPTA